ncbi:matrix metalloproteinase-25-like [Cylas formicarius]|uniref:matrix metalloproteinase-25-like n=1 Tax=Cylas formicarius TaxID=197179 RepID=UPI00295885A9|nr:matrix metalloproteinase-25-like [Cylas formicarius]
MCSTTEDDTTLTDQELSDYLQKYGFLPVNSGGDDDDDVSLTQIDPVSLEQALMDFQELYNLPMDGTLNNETIALIKNPRCGIEENAFTTANAVWNKTTLNWYIQASAPWQRIRLRTIANQVFKIWSSVSNLEFAYNYMKPDILILITDKSYEHKQSVRCQGNGSCSYKFDGKGQVLGHAFFPNTNQKCMEIHLDKDENWYFGNDVPAPAPQTSLYTVLLHEIGHTLGLGHSNDSASIMYPFYGSVNTLGLDDIAGIHRLYGDKTTISVSPSTTTTSKSDTKTTTKVTLSPPPPPHLCNILPDNFLITLNHHMYVFYDKWCWILRLGDRTYTEPKRIAEYVPMDKISHIYQRPNGQLVAIANNLFYVVDFPSFRIERKADIENLGVPQDKKINAIFSTYSGRTFILYDDNYFNELDECSLRPKGHGFGVTTMDKILLSHPTNLNSEDLLKVLPAQYLIERMHLAAKDGNLFETELPMSTVHQK